MEYDKFYKEQFFRNDVFNLEYDNIHDKEEEDIKRDVKRMEIKKKLKEKRKLKDVNALKGMDTDDLQKEIEKLKESYDKMKNVESDKVDLIMNNTEKLLYKGRLLNNYFSDKKNERGIPHFSLESEGDIGAKEIIDFKPLRKEEQARRYYDRCCCLKCRKKFNKHLVYARFWCLFLVDNQLFDNFSLLIIILNTIFILISDPRDNDNIANTSDQYFLYWYTFECILKIIAYGFVMTENAYLKDYWNCLDFFVVFVGWISWILERTMNGKKISGLAGLRAFRILRPLKTVKSVKGLRKLVIALLASISHLAETTIVLFFFFIIFDIAGVQMWQGLFLRRCMSLNYGYLISLNEKKTMCTYDSDCSEYNTNGNKYICVKAYRNPNNGVINFDNVLYGFVTVFVIVTLEGWAEIYVFVSRTFKDKIQINPIIIFAYFHFFVMIGGFYLINLFLAVTNSEFEKIEVTRKELIGKKSFYLLIKSRYDLKEKAKQEKKKKERALKNKNLTKSGESLRELYFKVDEEAFHITKNKRDIPIVYQTVKDMYIMTNNNPEELYTIEEMIDEEETHLCKDIKKQQKEIDRLIDEKKKEEKNSSKKRKDRKSNEHNLRTSRQSSINTSNSIDKKVLHDDKNEEKKKKEKEKQNEIQKKEEIIYKDAIEISINGAQKYLKVEMIIFQQHVNQQQQKNMNVFTTENNIRQKIENKEIEKFIQGQ
jgi:Ni,Fe-hydrogenase I cytochrome b subunit